MSAVSRGFTWLITGVIDVSKHIMLFRSYTFPVAINDGWTRNSTDIEEMVGVSRYTYLPGKLQPVMNACVTWVPFTMFHVQ